LLLASLHIGFIGGGNLARSLIGGLVQKGCSPGRIRVADPSAEQRELLAQRFGVKTSGDNREAAGGADVLVFAVKPQMFRQAALSLTGQVTKDKPLVISVAAGIATRDIVRWLGGRAVVVRAMPNTPALIGAGAAGLYATSQVSAEQRSIAAALLEAVGTALWIDDESLMDAVTALSGSGPAYYFLLMELMESAARELGLPPDAARRLALQTAYGAARMALESGQTPAELRTQVTSRGGTTAAAVKVFEAAGLGGIVLRALTAARDRGREMSREAGEEKP
jgi:pyrroline-5-carboxylate reductase